MDLRRFLFTTIIAVTAVILFTGYWVVHIEIQIHKERQWCSEHDGVFIKRHCFDKDAVLR
jgi:hypothetical protein